MEIICRSRKEWWETILYISPEKGYKANILTAFSDNMYVCRNENKKGNSTNFQSIKVVAREFKKYS